MTTPPSLSDLAARLSVADLKLLPESRLSSIGEVLGGELWEELQGTDPDDETFAIGVKHFAQYGVRIELTHCQLTDRVISLIPPNLTDLTLINCPDMTENLFSRLLQKLPNLTTFRMSRIAAVWQEKLQGCSRLNQIQFVGQSDQVKTFLHSSSPLKNQIEVLLMEGVTLDQDTLLKIATLPQLKVLQLGHCIAGEGLSDLLSTDVKSRLTALDLECFTFVRGENVRQIAEMTQLISLDLSGTLAKDFGSLTQLTNLTELSVANSGTVTEAEKAQLRAMNLETLVL